MNAIDFDINKFFKKFLKLDFIFFINTFQEKFKI